MIDYKKKYIKYKFKYLQAKQTFKGGTSSDSDEEEGSIRVTLQFVDGRPNKVIQIMPTDNIYNSIINVIPEKKLLRVQLGDYTISNDQTFKDEGVEDRARLTVSYRNYTVAEVAAEVAALNPHLTVERLMRNVEVDPADPSQVVGDLRWNEKGITVLPDSIGSLTVGGDLDLTGNQLTSLPEGFGSLTVGGSLVLNENQLASLPEGFGSLTVGGSLWLGSNQLTSLPEGFGSLTVGGCLLLEENQLISLPEDFGSLKVGGSLYLNVNQLASLPERFGSITVGGDLLEPQSVDPLPKEFGSLKVEGDLDLTGNILEKDTLALKM